MDMKKPLIAVVIVTVLVLAIVVLVFLGNRTENGIDKGANVDSDHSIIQWEGETGFPKMDGGFIFWSDFDDDSITRYEISTQNTESFSPIDDADYSLSEIFPSDGYIICDYLSGETLNITTESYIYDIGDGSLKKLDIDHWGISFDYPYVLYHTIGLEKQSLFLYNIETNSTELIEHSSWGEISGDHVVYVHENEAHIYKISTKEDTMIMDTDKSGIEIVISENKCLIMDTKDTGPEAKSDIYTYDISTKTIRKVGSVDEWIIFNEFDGRYLFWADGGPGEDVKVLDTRTNGRGVIASGQWIASLAYGTFSATNGMVVWASNHDIHFGKIVE